MKKTKPGEKSGGQRKTVEFTSPPLPFQGGGSRPNVGSAIPGNKSEDFPFPKIHSKENVKGRSSDAQTPRRSIGITAKLSNSSDRRTRIDNLGVYHEYKSYPERAKAEDIVYKTLNETILAVSSPSLPLPLTDEPDETRKSKSYLNDIIKPAISGGFIADGPTSVAPLVQASNVFVRAGCCICPPSLQEFPSELLSSEGKKQSFTEIVSDANRRMFFIKQTRRTPWWSFFLLIGFFHQRFEFVLYDKNGKRAMQVNGSQTLFGVYSTAFIKFPDGSIIAYMKQAFCDGSYKIYDDKDRVVFTLVGPVFSCYAPCVFCCCDEEFEIFFSGSANEVGRIGKYWSKDEFPGNQSSFGVSFPQSMSVRSKAIILGASLSIRYQYFVKLGNGIVLVPIYLGLVLAGVLLYFKCFSLCFKQ